MTQVQTPAEPCSDPAGAAARGDVRRDRQRLPGPAGRGRRAVAARGGRPDGDDRPGPLPLRRAATRSSSTWSRSRSTRPPPMTFARRGRRAARGRLRRPAGGLDRRVPDVGAGQPARVRPGVRQPGRRRAAASAARCSPWSRSGQLCTGQMRALWEHNHHPMPALEDLPAGGPRGHPGPADPGQGRRPGARGPRSALDLHAGLERPLRRGRPRGVRPHGPAGHRVRRDVRRGDPRLRARRSAWTTTSTGSSRSSGSGSPARPAQPSSPP